MPFSVAGTVKINGRPVRQGNVEIWAFDGDGDADLVATVAITSGIFTATVPDNVRQYRAIYDDGVNRGISDLDTPTGSAEACLIIIAGQSNATGRGDVAGLDRGLDLAAVYASATIAQKTSDATTNPIVWDVEYAARDLQPYRPSGQPGMGVELSMGRYLRTYVPAFQGADEPFLGKYAINGSALASWWIPSLGDDAVLPGTDNLFTQFVAYVRAKEVESGLPLGAIVWIQGEADATVLAQADAYATNMIAFHDALVAEFGTSMQFVMNKLHVDCLEAYTATVRLKQVEFATGRANVTLVDCDDIPLPAGDVHFNANQLASLGNRLAARTAEAVYPYHDDRRVISTAPWVQCANEPADFGTGALKPRCPVHKAGDDLFLVVSTGLANAAPTTPAGWTLVASKQSTTGGNFQNVYVYRFRAVDDHTPNPTIADTNNLNVAWVFSVRGGGASPIDVVATASNDAYNVTVNVPSVVTTGPDRLILHIFGAYSGDPNLTLSAWTNAALVGLAELRDSAFNVNGAGDGGIVALASGVKTTAGATGATAVTPSNISINCGITIAVKA